MTKSSKNLNKSQSHFFKFQNKSYYQSSILFCLFVTILSCSSTRLDTTIEATDHAIDISEITQGDIDKLVDPNNLKSTSDEDLTLKLSQIEKGKEEYFQFISKFDGSNPSDTDLRIAKLILDIRKQTQIEKVSGLLIPTLTLINTSSTFTPYRYWLSSLVEISNDTNISKQMGKCATEFQSSNTYFLKEHLITVCQHKLLNYVKNFKKFPTWQEVDLEKFLEKNFLLFYSGQNGVLFSALHKELSKEFQQIFVEKFLAASKEQFVPILAQTQKNLFSSEENHAYQKLIMFKNARIQQRKYFSQKLTQVYAKGGADELLPEYLPLMTKEIIDYAQLNSETLSPSYIIERLIVYADFLTRNNQHELARSTLTFLKTNFVIDESIMTDFHFNYMWSYITKSDFKSAIDYAVKNDLTLNYPTIDSKLQFWIARCYLNLGDKEKYVSYLETLSNVNILSFYGINALKELSENNRAAFTKVYNNVFMPNIAKLDLVIPLQEVYQDELKRVSAWAKLGMYPFLNMEYQYLSNKFKMELLSTFDDEKKQLALTQFHHAFAIAINNQKGFLSTFRLMSSAIQLGQIKVDYYFLNSLFPMPFQDLIASEKHDIDHILLYSLIRQESGFNPNARSQVGALGLMQLMPYTAKALDRSIASQSISDPKLNVGLGTKYLDKLLKKYNNNLIFTLAAYNAGDHKVNSWQKSYFKYDSFLHNIESIPYAETRNYVKLIIRNMFFYKLVRGDSINGTGFIPGLDPAIEETNKPDSKSKDSDNASTVSNVLKTNPSSTNKKIVKNHSSLLTIIQ